MSENRAQILYTQQDAVVKGRLYDLLTQNVSAGMQGKKFSFGSQILRSGNLGRVLMTISRFDGNLYRRSTFEMARTQWLPNILPGTAGWLCTPSRMADLVTGQSRRCDQRPGYGCLPKLTFTGNGKGDSPRANKEGLEAHGHRTGSPHPVHDSTPSGLTRHKIRTGL